MRYLIIILLFASCSKKWDCNCELVVNGYSQGQYKAFEYKYKGEYSTHEDECVNHANEHNKNSNYKDGLLICGGVPK